MTAKDYVAIAKVIREVVDIHGVTAGVRLTAESMADMLADDNPRFDYDRFLTACGFKEI